MEHNPEQDPPSFSKTFSADPGTYQYKFRLGTGDWWVLDATQETGQCSHCRSTKAMNFDFVTTHPSEG